MFVRYSVQRIKVWTINENWFRVSTVVLHFVFPKLPFFLVRHTQCSQQPSGSTLLNLSFHMLQEKWSHRVFRCGDCAGRASVCYGNSLAEIRYSRIHCLQVWPTRSEGTCGQSCGTSYMWAECTSCVNFTLTFSIGDTLMWLEHQKLQKVIQNSTLISILHLFMQRKADINTCFSFFLCM